jgi:CubicO group peptidase (beta-lactamase class C family)
MAQAFNNNETQRTRTVLIAYKNRILAERYSSGFNKDTPVLGWSMTKSILATLYGILQFQGKIDLSQPAALPEWENDERRNITLDHLLRMQSGLAWDEDYSTISDVTRMLFMEADMAHVQIEKKAVALPAEVWNYSSGTSNLLSGILRNQFESEQAYLDFPYKELIDKTGMHSMMLEVDLAGNFVGSSYGWANTRDWARFGLLYLNEGMWNGEQLFGSEWVEYVTRPTAHSNGRYGAHFWLNAGNVYPGVPKDLYSANGYQGQYVFVIPSLNLVIVRTGLAEPPDFELNTFLQAAIAAIKS